MVDQRWINGSNTDVDRYQYGYDRDGNRLYKDNKVLASLSEVYTYDSLNQIASYKLGTLNGTKTDVTGSPSNSQSWAYDAVGNWDSVTTNSTTQTRTANKQNEITTVSGATTPTYDNNGNLTTDENNYRFVYDAWNKVVQVKNSSNVVIVAYGRDALHRHVTDTVGSMVTDRFFSSDWQLLETKVGSNTVTRNVWSPVYVDGLVLRDRDTDGNGSLDERLYALQDANWNTTALINSSGTGQERYTYTPFGQVTFRDGSGSTLSASAKDWVFLHQGGERIAAGDYEFRNRVYSPSLGRWLSNDPLGFNAGDQNWYRAIGNNPGNGGDPEGLEEPHFEIGAYLIGNFGIGHQLTNELSVVYENLRPDLPYIFTSPFDLISGRPTVGKIDLIKQAIYLGSDEPSPGKHGNVGAGFTIGSPNFDFSANINYDFINEITNGKIGGKYKPIPILGFYGWANYMEESGKKPVSGITIGAEYKFPTNENAFFPLFLPIKNPSINIEGGYINDKMQYDLFLKIPLDKPKIKNRRPF